MFHDIKQVEAWIKGFDPYAGALPGDLRAWYVLDAPPSVLRVIMRAHAPSLRDYVPGTLPPEAHTLFAPDVLAQVHAMRSTWGMWLDRPGWGWFDRTASVWWTRGGVLHVHSLAFRLGARASDWQQMPALRPSISVARWFGDEAHADAVLDVCLR